MDGMEAILVGVGLAGLVLWARLFEKRNRIEFRARVCEVLAAAAKRELPFVPLLVCV